MTDYVQVVEDDSPYVGVVRAVLRDSAPRVRSLLSSAHFQNYCMHLATSLLACLLDSIWQLQHISRIGG